MNRILDMRGKRKHDGRVQSPCRITAGTRTN
jgi:hypothetical protein